MGINQTNTDGSVTVRMKSASFDVKVELFAWVTVLVLMYDDLSTAQAASTFYLRSQRDALPLEEMLESRPCSFTVSENSMVEGKCTFYGACRYKRFDYMLRSVCSSPGMASSPCEVSVSSTKNVIGWCDAGHCRSAGKMKLGHPDCPLPESRGRIRILKRRGGYTHD